MGAIFKHQTFLFLVSGGLISPPCALQTGAVTASPRQFTGSSWMGQHAPALWGDYRHFWAGVVVETFLVSVMS